MFVLRRHPRPQTECPVHVNPRTLFVSPCADLFGWIKRARIHISRLDADDGSFGKTRQFVLTHAPLAVCFNRGHALPSETCQAQCFEDGSMHLRANDHFDRRRTKHSVLDDIPPLTCKERLPCGRERGEIRHGGASDQSSRAIRRQSESFANPSDSDVLQCRRNGRHHSKCRILVPRPSEPVGSQRRRQHATIHETKITSTSRCHRGRRAQFVEPCNHFAWLVG